MAEAAAVSQSTSLEVEGLRTRDLWRQGTGESARRSSHYPRKEGAVGPCAEGSCPGSCTMEEVGALGGGRTGRGPGVGPEQTRAAAAEGWHWSACRRTLRPGRGISHSNQPSQRSPRHSGRGMPHASVEGAGEEVEVGKRTFGLCRPHACRRGNETAGKGRLCWMEADSTPPQEPLVVCF